MKSGEVTWAPWASLSFLGTLCSLLQKTQMYCYEHLSQPHPASCLGPLLTPKPMPLPTKASSWSEVCVHPSSRSLWVDTASSGSLRHSTMLHTIGTKVGLPRRNQKLRPWKSERSKTLLFSLQPRSLVLEGILIGTWGVKDPFLMLPLPSLLPITMACTFSSPLPLSLPSWPALQSLGAGSVAGGKVRPHPRWGPWP